MPFTFNFGGFDPSAFGGFGGGEASQPQRPRRERKPRKAIGNAFTRTLINLGVTLLFGLGYFYFELPALNFHAEEFYVFLFLLCAVYCVCAVLTSGFQGEGVKGYFGFVKKQCTIPFFVLIALIAAMAYDTLFFDFVYEVIREKLMLGSNELKDSDVRVFFKDKQQQSEKVAGWTDATLVRLGRCYKTMLYEAGVIDKGKPARKIFRPILDPELTRWLEKNDMAVYIKALTGV